MFNWIKEYFRKPQVGDIWYFQPENPFIDPSRYIIVAVRGKWVQIESANATSVISKIMSRREESIKYLKYVYKREI